MVLTICSAKPITTKTSATAGLTDTAVRISCPTYCWSKSSYGDKASAARCPDSRRIECVRNSQNSDGILEGQTCYCADHHDHDHDKDYDYENDHDHDHDHDHNHDHDHDDHPTTKAPPSTVVTSVTDPTVPPNVPGNAPYGTPTPQGPVTCDTIVLSGHAVSYLFNIDIRKTASTNAVVVLDYHLYEIPDKILVKYGNKTLLDSSGPVSGEKSVELPVRGSGSIIDVYITSPNPYSAWDFMLSCA